MDKDKVRRNLRNIPLVEREIWKQNGFTAVVDRESVEVNNPDVDLDNIKQQLKNKFPDYNVKVNDKKEEFELTKNK